MSDAAENMEAPEAGPRSAAKSQAMDQQLNDGDRDSLHTLPLGLLPLNMPSLLRAKMLKDNHMRTMVEMFTSGSGASGRMEVEALESVFDNTDEFKEDLAILGPMEKLLSFDVYSLCIELRRLGIPIADQAGLQLY
ncbi:MAG: hypothetical protein VCE74_11765, partial [Alphaproteobacteria bacterium]